MPFGGRVNTFGVTSIGFRLVLLATALGVKQDFASTLLEPELGDSWSGIESFTAFEVDSLGCAKKVIVVSMKKS